MAQFTRRSQVFIVRTWQEYRGHNLYELRGMVRELHSGETRYFRTWESFLDFVGKLLVETEEQAATEETGQQPAGPVETIQEETDQEHVRERRNSAPPDPT